MLWCKREMSNGALMLNSIGMVEQLVLKEKGIAQWCFEAMVGLYLVAHDARHEMATN